MNAVPVKTGDVIYNANPPRVAAASGKPVSAEVHALGNTEGRGVFALEIRRPGTTFRAWDNVRFPLRDIDIDAALDALNLKATRAADFVVEPKLVRPACAAPSTATTSGSSISSRRLTFAIDVPPPPRIACMRCEAACGSCVTMASELGTLERGESAFVPLHVGAYRVVADGEPASARQSRFAAVCRTDWTDQPRPATLRIDLDALARNYPLVARARGAR